jgi:hypothetical protein
MRTYLALFGLLLCSWVNCLSQQLGDYLSCRQWVEQRIGGTNQIAKEERIFVVSGAPEYAAIVQFRKGITLREIIDQTRFRNATLTVVVKCPNKSEDRVFPKVGPSDTPEFEVKKTDLLWLFDISPPLWLAKLPNTALEPTATAP